MIARLVWDLPTRLFHWSAVVLVATAWLTQHEGWMAWHFYAGYALLSLLLFRLGWGIWGSETARFGAFLRGPRAALGHLRQLTRREPDSQVGHNPAGGWMVLALLGLLLAQAGTGLCSNDQVETYGPFAQALGQSLSDRITSWHAWGFTVLETAVALHVAAVAVYAIVKRHDLVRPMITGSKRLPQAVAPPRIVPCWRAAATLAVAAALVALLVGLWGATSL
ncbi:MAG: cytochrome b/b6 domain-containing protein [Rhodospirillales bacterium]|nr:cytochrome b/b6 domain-containing protein [Rhodospirillales bacterium]